jgi:hypothetical protein
VSLGGDEEEEEDDEEEEEQEEDPGVMVDDGCDAIVGSVVISGCPNQEIRCTFLFKGLMIGTISYFGYVGCT